MSREEFLPGSVVPKRFEWSTDWKRPRPSWSSSYGLKDTDKLVLWEGTGDPFFVRKDGSQRLPPKGVHLSSESIGLLYDLVDDGPLGLTALHENWPFAMHLYIIHPGYRPMGCAYKILKSGVWYFGVYRGYYLLCGDEGYTQFKDKEAEDAKKEGREPEDINEPERQPWVVGDVPEELNWHDDFDADQIRIYTEPFPVCHPPIAKDRVIVTDLARPSPSWRGKATRADIYASASYQLQSPIFR
ncbi:uncharacterized protein K452DRAFT_292579 [Aplosporella prunicola CBS 121167]|uniref:Uncharacterized protein n=1 Tax=Aplosporella prunicola CBS 121167 TaxID=1176127 RepID=A0A6A6AYX4_9PEZI|nr:uncharacterized protein K452DRAFT_292579 [Aplosporella prunicola CBS 121167]KAF2136204.1 hypothetical protein K452DRAFT_292579 [Aplosporella prunicola CBS 121167]